MENDLQRLGEGLIKALIEQRYSKRRITEYQATLACLGQFMFERGYSEYTVDIGSEFAMEVLGGLSYSELTSSMKDRLRHIRILREFYETGILSYRRLATEIVLEGELGESILEFIKCHDEQKPISNSTRQDYRRYLREFADFLMTKGVHRPQDITPDITIDYIDLLGQKANRPRVLGASMTRAYLKHLASEGITEHDCSRTIPPARDVRQVSLPSTYTDDEIEKLLAGIDTASPVGKRDFAMVTVLARLGLRASDVCLLKFSNISWEQGVIQLSQNKTGRVLALPLLPDVGEAIISYLEYGRPISDSPFVFLRACAPYDHPITAGCLTGLVRKYMARSGIDIDNRHSGAHALRHSLAKSMLSKSVPLPVISGILGHQSINSTYFYLRIDPDAMKCCSLDVPPVDPDFYGRCLL